MIDRAYQEKNIPCFSLSDELLTTEERRRYLKKAYQDDQIPFSVFSWMRQTEIS